MLTVAVDVASPEEFEAVRVNVVVEATNTFIEPLSTGVTVPTPGEMERLVAFLTFQLSVTESPPATIEEGSARNETMVGFCPCGWVDELSLHPPARSKASSITEDTNSGPIRRIFTTTSL